MGESGARYAPADRVADRVRSMHFVGLRRLLRREATAPCSEAFDSR
jgi:hypothetical protein